MSDNIVFVVTGHSESGDDYIAAFRNRPTQEQVSELAHGWDGDSDKEGPGEDGSYVHITVHEETLL